MERSNKYNFYREDDKSQVWWVDNGADVKGEMLFSFDREKVYNLFSDYPHKLTQEEKATFDKSEPFWAEFFADRK